MFDTSDAIGNSSGWDVVVERLGMSRIGGSNDEKDHGWLEGFDDVLSRRATRART